MNVFVAFICNVLNTIIKDVAAQRSRGKKFSRHSILSLSTMIRLLLGAEGGTLDTVLHSAGIKVSASAVSQRRAQIEPEVFREVFDRFNTDCPDSEYYNGYRIMAVDGTAINLPRNPASPSFVRNDGIPKGVNQLHLTPLYDLMSRTFFDAVIQPEPKNDEIGALISMLERNTFREKTLIIGDRRYESYNLIAHLLEKPNVDFLIRIKQNYSAMREVAKLPMLELDCDISFSICTTQKNADKADANNVYLR